jgi:hypothetical protein
MGPHDGLVDLQVGGRAAQALDIDAPFLVIQVERLQCSCLAQQLDGVNVLVSSVVAGSWVTLGVLVGHGRAQGVKDRSRRHILRGNEDDGFSLAFDLFFLLGWLVVCWSFLRTWEE